MNELSTHDKLILLGKQEFLAKGFKDASLREITKKAGFTLGAFYGYYPSKEALFDAIVKEPARHLYEYYSQIQEEFSKLPAKDQVHGMDEITEHGLFQILDIIYEDFDIFTLIFFRSAGTEYESYMQKLIDVEIHHTKRFIQLVQNDKNPVDIEEELIHILCSAMFSGVLEIVEHHMDKHKAIHYISQLRSFYASGWNKLLFN